MKHFVFVIFFALIPLLITPESSAVMPPWMWENPPPGHHLSPPSMEKRYEWADEILQMIELPVLDSYGGFESDAITKLDQAAELIMAAYPPTVYAKVREFYYGNSYITRLPYDGSPIFDSDFILATSRIGNHPEVGSVILAEELSRMPILDRLARIRFIALEVGMRMTIWDKVGGGHYGLRHEEIGKISRIIGWIIENEFIERIPYSLIMQEIEQSPLGTAEKLAVQAWFMKLSELNKSSFFGEKIIYHYPVEVRVPYLGNLIKKMEERFYGEQKLIPERRKRIEGMTRTLKSELEELVRTQEGEDAPNLFKMAQEAKSSGDQMRYHAIMEVMRSGDSSSCVVHINRFPRKKQ